MSTHEKVVALLPMKAHSERVPGKNFKELGGKPLFRWVLDTLLSLSEIDQIVINTDAREILMEHGLGAEPRIRIRERKEAICGDFVDMNAIIKDDLDAVDADMYLMTHTTNPLLSAQTISDAIDEYRNAKDSNRADSLFSVNLVQARFYRADGTAVNHDPANLIRTQDLEMWFEENSNLYIFSSDSFTATGARIGRQPLLFPTPALESVDIDGPDDWALAVALSRMDLSRHGH
ncbi:MAG: acylneuraminate cytidylyltransferase family protein [Myxococcota bacterium]|jgi:CMP-N-acetylneuraminic acid synthetase|nr:acylneuraminate cytidylyltransferase family protein [Myxococcota bacterium]MDP7298710.1 acylneuraminate cytidylyltransferase family protein [Myxococcota bacterium]MDP7433424.1 acylneuraminate cytidylyltransferase family protein [Myxococcota bacterium]